MKRIAVFLVLILTLTATGRSQAFAAGQTVETRYTRIHYENPVDINKFIFRIGGQKFDFISNKDLASSKIDRLIDRVQAILDMRVPRIKIDIFLKSGELDRPEIAYYDTKTRAIHVSSDKVTDGVFAHEAAHAIINEYFKTPPTSKVQEILAQYVDKQLWSEY